MLHIDSLRVLNYIDQLSFEVLYPFPDGASLFVIALWSFLQKSTWLLAEMSGNLHVGNKSAIDIKYLSLGQTRASYVTGQSDLFIEVFIVSWALVISGNCAC